MSLDIDLKVTIPTTIWHYNITHNLGKMAAQVKFEDGLTLYDVLWRPEEKHLNLACDIEDYLDRGWNILMSEPNFYKTFNPENGWGSYEGLCEFVYQYRKACQEHPLAEVHACR